MQIGRGWGLLLALVLCGACDDGAKGGDAESGTPTAEAKPPVEIVARTVSLQRKVDGKEEDQSWSAIEGKVFAVITTDVAHNTCNEGDEIDSKNAKLTVEGANPESVGGGADPKDMCVLCQAKDKIQCSGGFARMRPFTFVFQLEENADVAKGTLSYRGGEAELSKANLIDRRGNAELNAQIEAKKAELAAMKKKLENTGNKANGEILISEMKEVERQIKELEAKLVE